MKSSRCLGLMLCASVMLLPVPAMAHVGGLWRVSGYIEGRSFVVDCRFVPAGTQFGGECIELETKDGKPPKAGKKHELKQGSAAGANVRWSYPVKFMMMSIDVNFAGTMNGNRMSGNVTAKGREGQFTAVKI